jgi:PKD repeat protein
MPPLAIISELSVLEGLVEGDNLTLSGSNSIETEGDRTSLAFVWDSSHLDSDLDGEKTGDVDFTGANWTVENLPAGTWTITLTVTDDNGEFHQSEITVVVAPAPVEGIVESITEALGGTMTAVIGLLGIVIVGLVIFLLFSRQGTPVKDDGFGLFDQSAFAAPPAVVPLVTTAPVQTVTTAPIDPTPTVSMPQMDTAPVAAGPPLPSTGLPQGWTMEQWVHYGEQWLAANQPAPAPVQPILSQTPPTPASSALQSLLDDLDF